MKTTNTKNLKDRKFKTEGLAPQPILRQISLLPAADTLSPAKK